MFASRRVVSRTPFRSPRPSSMYDPDSVLIVIGVLALVLISGATRPDDLPLESRHTCHSLAVRYLHKYLYMTTMHSV